jgi:hypothetical protein
MRSLVQVQPGPRFLSCGNTPKAARHEGPVARGVRPSQSSGNAPVLEAVKPNMRRAMVLLLLVLTTSSCAAAVESDQRQPTFLPTLPPSNVWPTALLLGRLAERDGCVLLRAGRTWVLLLWPDGYAAEQGGDSGLRVVDENGKLVAAVGDRVRLGGGVCRRISESGIPGRGSDRRGDPGEMSRRRLCGNVRLRLVSSFAQAAAGVLFTSV